MPVFLALAFSTFLLVSAATGNTPWTLPAYYAALSAAAFIAYAIDKSAARQGRWRIAENTLHLLALLGGWPGALAAQRLLRHKTRKPAFQLRYWGSVMLNCAVLGWLTSSPTVRAAIAW